MNDLVVSKYADGLYLMSQEDQGPFPYEDCRKLLQEVGNKLYGDLVPDLNTYFYEIYSYSAGAKNLVTWSNEELAQSRKLFHKSFFDRYPQYAALQPIINQDNVPALAQRMSLYNQMRLSLTKFIKVLIDNHNTLKASQQRELLEAHN